ncbi:MAG: deoxyribonuclease IV [bacterium]|nr:deoxyribonuclease IV [Candidatus Aquidulcis sp.]
MPTKRPKLTSSAPAAAAGRLDRMLGAHLAAGPGLVKAADRAAAVGAMGLQIFTGNPTGWARRAELPKELPAFRARMKEHGFGPLAVHAAYLANLAGPNPVFREKTVELLRHELRVAPEYGASFVNVHIGSHMGTGIEAGVARVAEAVERILDGVPVTDDSALLVLENSAGGGNGIGENLDELIDIHEAMAARGVDLSRVAYCLDSAHLWGAGIAMNGDVEVDRLVEQFDKKIGLEKLVMIHYNDSKAAHGSKLDRHQHIGGGEVGTRGLAALIRHPRLAHVNYYLETPGMEAGWDKLNVERSLQLAGGALKLKPLPAEEPTVPKGNPTAAKPSSRTKGRATKRAVAKRSAQKRSGANRRD